MKLGYIHSLALAILFVFSLNTHAKQIFLWDLDDVLLKKDKQAEEYKSALSIGQLLGGVLPDFILHPTLAWEIYKLRQAGVGGEAIEQKAQEYGALNLKTTIHNILTTKKPIDNMEEILSALKEHGYKQYIGTNMGKNGFETVTQTYTALFDKFEQPLNEERHMFVDYSNEQARDIIKPNPSYFEAWFTKMKAQDAQFDPNNVIFIDDKQENLDGALEAGIGTVIIFESPEQLKQELKTRDINI